MGPTAEKSGATDRGCNASVSTKDPLFEEEDDEADALCAGASEREEQDNRSNEARMLPVK